jgi:hypothetical protein
VSYILPSDLDWVGSASDTALVAKLISKAEIRLASIVGARGGDLLVLAADPTKLLLIQDILENAVARVLRNPEGLKSESEGDYSYTLNALDASGNIWFPDSEIDAIYSVASSYGSIRLGITAPGWNR